MEGDKEVTGRGKMGSGDGVDRTEGGGRRRDFGGEGMAGPGGDGRGRGLPPSHPWGRACRLGQCQLPRRWPMGRGDGETRAPGGWTRRRGRGERSRPTASQSQARPGRSDRRRFLWVSDAHVALSTPVLWRQELGW